MPPASTSSSARRVLRRDRDGGAFVRGLRPSVVAGGGNSAGQAALFLAESGSPVTIVIPAPDLDREHVSLPRRSDRSRQAHRRATRSTRIVALEVANRSSACGSAVPSGEETIASGAAVLVHRRRTRVAVVVRLRRPRRSGFVLTDRSLGRRAPRRALGRARAPPLPFETSHPGLFAVGDVRSGSTKRVAAAVGEGSAAVRSVHEYLAFNRHA